MAKGNSLYKNSELTRWFSPNVKPARKGVYNASLYKNPNKYRRWTGRDWTIAEDTPERAAQNHVLTGQSSCVYWRGLNKEPK